MMQRKKGILISFQILNTPLFLFRIVIPNSIQYLE